MEKLLDTFIDELAGYSSPILPLAEDALKTAVSQYGLTKDDALFVLKDYNDVESKIRGEAGDRQVESLISTLGIDYDKEVVLPEGMDKKDYEERRVVLWSHLYSQLGVGKNLWLKNVDNVAIGALTQFFSEKANPVGQQLYNYYNEGGILGDSIGFIPVEYATPDDGNWKRTFDKWYKRAAAFYEQRRRKLDEAILASIKRIFTKWILLEYSKVMVPANPFALQLALQKGLISGDDMERYTLKTEDMEDGGFWLPPGVSLSASVSASDIVLADLDGEPFDPQKPYPNEHACRLHDPSKYSRLRRKNCFRRHADKCVDYIFGRRKSDGKSEVQAYRYKKSDGWTATAAKTHCKEAGGSFEAAAESSSLEDSTTDLIDAEYIRLHPDDRDLIASVRDAVVELIDNRDKDNLTQEDSQLLTQLLESESEGEENQEEPTMEEILAFLKGEPV